MKLEGTYTFEAPREASWQALLDPEVLAAAMPGCEALEKIGDNEYKGMLKIRIGPVQGQFEGLVTITDLNPPESYQMVVNGRGGPGIVSGRGQVQLEDQGDCTVLHYSGDADISGRITSVGQRLLDSSAKALTRQSLDALHEQIKARQAAENQAEPPPPVEGPSTLRFASGVTRDIVADLIPPERYPLLVAVGLLLAAALVGLVMLRRSE